MHPTPEGDGERLRLDLLTHRQRWHFHHAHRVDHCRRHEQCWRAWGVRWRTTGWLILAGMASAVMAMVSLYQRQWPQAIALGLCAYAISRLWTGRTMDVLDDHDAALRKEIRTCPSCRSVQHAQLADRICARCDAIARALRRPAAAEDAAPDH